MLSSREASAIIEEVQAMATIGIICTMLILVAMTIAGFLPNPDSEAGSEASSEL
jgi:hypothetical protein